MITDVGLGQVGKVQRSIAKRTERVVEELLRDNKIRQPRWWISQRGRIAAFGACLAVALGAILVYQLSISGGEPDPNLPNSATMATALIATIVSVFAYYQWNDARRELSLDRFYDRLRIVNERQFEWPHTRRLVGHYWPASDGDDNAAFQKAMYVYLELDNLEYIVVRYQLGFVARSLLSRATGTFSSRCQSAEFASLAKDLVRRAGYVPETIDVVDVLADAASESVAAPDDRVHKR